jgi:dinuclear metal center YbgI/SA1388 family protein
VSKFILSGSRPNIKLPEHNESILFYLYRKISLMQVADVLNLLDQWAPLAYSEDFDNTGLLVGDPKTEVRGILVSLDTLESVIDEAISEDCNLVVSFHPIIFSGLKSLKTEDYVTHSVVKAIKNDIAIIAIHTALDNMPHGVSAGMAQVLGLQNTRVLMPKNEVMYKLITYVPHQNAEQLRTALFKAGAGALGHYEECSFNVEGTGTFKPIEGAQPTLGQVGKQHSEAETQVQVSFMRHQKNALVRALKQAHPYEEVAYDLIPLNQACPEVGMGLIGTLPSNLSLEDLLKTLKTAFNCGCIKYSENGPKDIHTVAVLGGSGSFAIDQAKALGAQVYITADLKYHDYFKGQSDFTVMDIGHYESEQFTKDLIVDYLSKKITNFAPSLPIVKVLKSNVKTNPISYY